MDKAIEAAARAILNHEDDLGWYAVEPEPTSLSLARAAIRAFLSALKEDPEVLERVARAICESEEVPPDEVAYTSTEDGSTTPQWETYTVAARAALSALEVE